MLRQILASAVIAGALAGILVSGLQEIRVVPLILEAETYESANDAPPITPETTTTAHHHDAAAPGIITGKGPPRRPGRPGKGWRGPSIPFSPIS